MVGQEKKRAGVRCPECASSSGRVEEIGRGGKGGGCGNGDTREGGAEERIKVRLGVVVVTKTVGNSSENL